MKSTKLTLLSFLSIALLMYACSGEQKEASSEETMEDTTTVVAEPMAVSIDLDGSQVMWKGEMLGLYSHEGLVALKEANVTMAGDDLVGGSFVVDMTSITPTDDAYKPEEGSTKEKLVGHLSSADFFAVDSFPTASFTIETVEGNKAMGTLEVRGRSNPATVENIAIMSDESGKMITGTLTFNRTNYGVNFSMPVQDKVLSDDIQLAINLKTAAGM